MKKEEVRKNMLSQRERLSFEEVKLRSRAIKFRLFNSIEFRRAEIIHFYVGFKNEVDTEEMIQQALELRKRVVVPRINIESNELELSELKDFKKDLNENSSGLKEPRGSFFRPVDPRMVQLMVVPGLAFDLSGHRIGYGKGYYDRLLSKCPSATFTGLAFEFQILKSLPSFQYDVKMNSVITEYREIKINDREISSP